LLNNTRLTDFDMGFENGSNRNSNSSNNGNSSASVPAPYRSFGNDPQQHPIVLNHNNNYATEEYNAAEVVEESLSIADKERELIRKALRKHKGKRKDAATDLGISERTLYRKIKEYQIGE